jgi:hypothetical protein
MAEKDNSSEQVKEKIEYGADSKCKMDVGYKKFLRCARKSLRQWFNDWCPTNSGARYKWNKKPNKAQIWYDQAEKFLI